jgi:hypothetical protein
MATINLGAIKFNWQGAYAGGTAYAVDDVVSYNGSSYVCILASTGNLPTNATYFEQMSSAGTNGTNGTDLTTTLTTQGDLVYRDGSGLQRLGAGTAGQVLQTGGAGANPSWGTVSSDFVKLATANVNETSDVIAVVQLNNVFDDTIYHTYKLLISGVNSNSTSFRLSMRYVDNTNSAITSSNYHYLDKDIAYRNSGTVNMTPTGVSAWGTDAFKLGHNWDSGTLGSGYTGNYSVTIFNPETSNYKFIIWDSIKADAGSPYLIKQNGGGFLTTGTVKGLQLYGSGYYFRQMQVQLYGLKK